MEKQMGPTPHGGAYSIALFLDKECQPTEKEKAVNIKIVEFTAEDKPIFTTYMTRGEGC